MRTQMKYLFTLLLAMVTLPAPTRAFSTMLARPLRQGRLKYSVRMTKGPLRCETATDDVKIRRVLALFADTSQFMPTNLGPSVLPAALVAAAASAAAFTGADVNGVPVAESLCALVAGVTTVAAITAVVDEMTRANIPSFDPSIQRFDQSGFGGRYCRMLLACDPRLLLHDRELVQECKLLVDNHEAVVDGTQATDRALWEAKRIVDAALHPETGTWIPRPFRMSGYVPFNGPICIGMVAMAQSTAGLVLWSWLNQSQNALINYFNRNASSAVSTRTLLQSYALAVGSALAVAVGLSSLIHANCSPADAAALLRFVAFPSAVLASSLNCFVIRRPEIPAGIPLLDPSLRPLLLPTTSHAAAARAVYATTASRAVLQIPAYFFPPLILEAIAPFKAFLLEHPAAVVRTCCL